jgi:anaerobic selenocysteine-containing dehydrogenase
MFHRWESPGSVFQLLKQLSAGQPCDITGIDDFEMLDRCGGIQWPYPSENSVQESPTGVCEHDAHPTTERRLFVDGRFFHPDGRARFIYESPRTLPEEPTAKFPFLLLTGRGSAAQWHTQTRTAKSAVLNKLYPTDIYVELSPSDSQRLGIRSGDRVVVSSQRGRLLAQALVTPGVQPGELFIPMHYEATNRLTHASFDPYSHQPAYKACAVAIERLR